MENLEFEKTRRQSVRALPLLTLAIILVASMLPLVPTTDAQTIGAPQNLTATAVSSSQINLAWNAPSGGSAASYTIYRGTTPGGETRVGNYNFGSTLTFQDTWLQAGMTYYYHVSAVTSSGSESAMSNEVSATTVTIGPPQSLTATVVSSSQINLAWNAPSSGTAASYKIYRGTTPNGETAVGTYSFGTNLKFQDSWLQAGTKYYYQVAAVTGPGSESQKSSEASATTVTIGAPQGLTATAVGSSQINLAWNAPSSGTASTYTIYRGTTPGGETRVGNYNFGSTLTFQDSWLQAGTKYYYQVAAVTAPGSESAKGSEVSATTVVIGAPQSLTATAVSSSQINLAWNAPSSGTAASYTIYRGTTSGGETRVGNYDFGSTLTFQDTNRQAGTAYYYQVTAVTGPGSESAKGNEASAMPGTTTSTTTTTAAPSPTIPNSPTPASPASNIGTNADLSWMPGDTNPGDTVTFNVYLDAGSSATTVRCSSLATRICPNANLGGLKPSTTYTWHVSEYDGQAAATFSPTWTFTTAAGTSSTTTSTTSSNTPTPETYWTFWGDQTAPGPFASKPLAAFSWSTVNGATYTWRIAKYPYDAASVLSSMTASGLTDTSHTVTLSDLPMDASQFQWTVTAALNGQESSPSTPRYFQMQRTDSTSTTGSPTSTTSSSTTASSVSTTAAAWSTSIPPVPTIPPVTYTSWPTIAPVYSPQVSDLWNAIQSVVTDPQMRMAMLDGAALETGDHWFESNPFPDQIPVGPGRGPFQIEAGPGGNPPCTISETDARDIAKSIHCLLPRFKEAIDAFNDYKDYGPLFAGNPQCKMTSKTPPPDIPTHPELAYAAMACLAERPQNPYGPHQIQHAWDLASSVSSPQSVPAPLAGAPPQSLPAPSAWQIPGLLVVLVATTLIVRRRLPS